MRLYELNTNPQPSGGQCVLCGGSIRFVIDTDKEPIYRRAVITHYGPAKDAVETQIELGWWVKIGDTDEVSS